MPPSLFSWSCFPSYPLVCPPSFRPRLFPKSDMYATGPGVISSQDGGVTLSVSTASNTVAKLALELAVATSGETILVGGIGGGLAYSYDAGATWAAAPGLKLSACQDVKFARGLFTACGSFNGSGGVLIGADPASLTFAKIPVGTFLGGTNLPRYCSVPSASVMYATAGTWDMSASEAPRAGVHHLSRRVAQSKEGVHLLPPREAGGEVDVGDDSVPAAWGQVGKSVDGGVTWTVVYEDVTSGMYPNDIQCWDENSCAFVMDGSDTPNESQVISTLDGGSTWTTFSIPTGAGNSLMSLRMTGPTEVWAAGGDSTGRLWHTTDLVNWDDSAFSVKDAAYDVTSFAIGPGGTAGFATGALLSQLCSVVKFEF